ncbi:MAG: preprotein translocase subunit SecY, partial [Xanthomonadales bacterium]|nr:preprotein translocase subunit SecY [Xanthomonadales bacterium]NIO13279.1 preprotein translocase subunit SecY [Xanthomonadales bacterium]
MKFLFVGALLLTAGTLFLMWIGEQIDQHGIGNGISLIITVNILARLPSAVYDMRSRIQSADSPQNAILKVVLLLALFVAIVVAIVYVTRGERRIPVQQQKHVRGPKIYGGQKHYLPLRVNTAGVLPIIFASVLLQFPQTIALWAQGQFETGS